MGEMEELRAHNKLLHEQVSSLKALQEKTVKELNRVQGEVQHLRNDQDHQVAQVQALRAKVTMYEEHIDMAIARLEILAIDPEASEETKQRICLLEQQLVSAEERIKLVKLENQNQISELKGQLIEGEKYRKSLLNTILVLKGNIRVFCRVRPLLPSDQMGLESTAVSYPTSLETIDRGVDVTQSGNKYSFTFDQVFKHEASQETIFLEVSQLVQNALDGYKVCIFAYGQTGSGKTYTMMGKPEQNGLIPRILEQIFQSSQSLRTQGWKYQMRVSMLEIYNETIRDLLSPNGPCREKQYTIKLDANGNTYVSNINIVDVCRIGEVSSLLQQAANKRSVAKTQMNEQSSRSHFVFTLRISGINENTEQQVEGVVNLIDLAGSERVSRSGATGDRLKEAQGINKSLSALGDVISALAKKEDHIPFRNSKLTHVLRPCLGGDSKCLMIVNISPDTSSVGETLCSLRFATRVNACEIGVPRRQTSQHPGSSSSTHR